MGTILINTPQDIKVEYVLDDQETEKLIRNLHEIKGTPLSSKSDNLMGLFADDVELIDQITESAMKARGKDNLRVP